MNFKISKGRNANKLWRKLFDLDWVKFKNYANLREREACNNELNVLVQCPSERKFDNYVGSCP